MRNVCSHEGTRCWPCMTNGCYDEPTQHPWADYDDVEHAAKTGQPEPSGDCGCYFCGTPAIRRSALTGEKGTP